MGTQRVEAFSDGVIAVIITITAFDLKAPTEPTFAKLMAMMPYFLTYALSFMVVAIMWVNHHHMMHLAKHANAKVLWANNLLLFWMSLIPFTTSYMGQNHGAPMAVAAYGAVLTCSAAAFTLLRGVINQFHRNDAKLASHNSHIFWKSLATAFLYALSVPLAYLSVKVSFVIFVAIPAMYFLPERVVADVKYAEP